MVPLEGGFCMVRPCPKISKSTLLVYCLHRVFQLTFDSEAEMQDWMYKINLVLSKQVLIETYTQRLKRQRQFVASSCSEEAVLSTQAKIKRKLKEVQSLLQLK